MKAVVTWSEINWDGTEVIDRTAKPRGLKQLERMVKGLAEMVDVSDINIKFEHIEYDERQDVIDLLERHGWAVSH